MNPNRKTNVLPLPEIKRPTIQWAGAGPEPDVLGLKMGMEFPEVNRILLEQGFVRVNTKEGRMELKFGTPEIFVQSQNYRWREIYRRTREGNISDLVDVSFSSPLSGALLYNLSYMSLFPEAVAPPEVDVLNAMKAKYGEGNSDDVTCWTWLDQRRIREKARSTCGGGYPFANMLANEHVDLVLTGRLTVMDRHARTLDMTLRDARIESRIGDDFQSYVETIFPAARILRPVNRDPIKF